MGEEDCLREGEWTSQRICEGPIEMDNSVGVDYRSGGPAGQSW